MKNGNVQRFCSIYEMMTLCCSYIINNINYVFLGAESVCQSGGIINKVMWAYTIQM